jgi:hypothetical protein
MKLLENLNKDMIFKEHFIEMKNQKQVKTFNEKKIIKINLEKNDDIKILVFKYLFENLRIAYNLNDTNTLVSFVSLRGIYNQETTD